MDTNSKILLLAIFLLFVNCNSKREKAILAILPFYNISNEDIDLIQADVKTQFGFEIKLLDLDTLPMSTFVNIKTARYRADKLLLYLKKYQNNNYDYIMGITDKDISFTKYNLLGEIKEPVNKYKDFGIYGLASIRDKPSIVSTFRLGGKKRGLDRLRKIIVHEIGHNLGLSHCTSQFKNCIMKDAEESITTIDKLDPIFCDRCISTIRLP